MPNRRTLALIAAGLTMSPLTARLAHSACDLQATFTAPLEAQVAGGGPVTWTLRYRNAGDSNCTPNQIKLHRYAGSTASGYGSQVGGSGSTQALNELAPGQLQFLNFTEQGTPTNGSFTYKPACASPCNDANNTNQYPTKTVSFTASAASQSQPDLAVTAISVLNPKVGACNVARVTFRNNGGPINENWELVLKTFPTGNAFQDNHTYRLLHGAIGTGQTAVRQFNGVNLPVGATVQSLADSGQTIEESNENNNAGTQSYMPVAPCP